MVEVSNLPSHPEISYFSLLKFNFFKMKHISLNRLTCLFLKYLFLYAPLCAMIHMSRLEDNLPELVSPPIMWTYSGDWTQVVRFGSKFYPLTYLIDTHLLKFSSTCLGGLVTLFMYNMASRKTIPGSMKIVLLFLSSIFFMYTHPTQNPCGSPELFHFW